MTPDQRAAQEALIRSIAEEIARTLGKTVRIEVTERVGRATITHSIEVTP